MSFFWICWYFCVRFRQLFYGLKSMTFQLSMLSVRSPYSFAILSSCSSKLFELLFLGSNWKDFCPTFSFVSSLFTIALDHSYFLHQAKTNSRNNYLLTYLKKLCASTLRCHESRLKLNCQQHVTRVACLSRERLKLFCLQYKTRRALF